MSEAVSHRTIQASDQKFIEKLTRIVESNLEIREFGVEDLAKEVGMSRSLIYRKLQSITNQSVSRFIREIRLEKAMDLLNQNEGSVSEIAYRVGFGSPAYFITCFHEKYGYPPGEVKYRNLPKETKATINSLKSLWIALGIISVLVILFLILKPVFYPVIDNNSGLSTEKSIAVLPFVNLSNDPENKFIAFGIVDNILSQLAGIQGIKAISSTSSSNYAETSKSIPEIGQELGANFILEGSVQKYEENILIIVQLIQANDDKHIWSDEYNIELKDFLKTQSKISKQIAKNLNAILSNSEIESIDHLSTQNIEAHNLYVKGRFFLQDRKKEGFYKSLDYFSRAIEIDPEYALAYAGLAKTYSMLTGWRHIPVSEGYPFAKDYALTALNLDNSLAEAHTVLADIYLEIERNFKLSEQHYLRAIKIDPNYSTAYANYFYYLWLSGRNKEAREAINKAKELDPLSKMIFSVSASHYYNNGHINNALLEVDKVLEIDPDFVEAHYLLFFIYKEMNMPEEALVSFKKIKKIIRDEGEIDEIFQSEGIPGLLHYMINFSKQREIVNYYSIAEYYALLDEKDEVIFWLERLLAEEKLIAQILRVLNNRHFEKYRSDPDLKPIFAEIEQIRYDLVN